MRTYQKVGGVGLGSRCLQQQKPLAQFVAWIRLEVLLISWRRMAGILSKSADLCMAAHQARRSGVPTDDDSQGIKLEDSTFLHALNQQTKTLFALA